MKDMDMKTVFKPLLIAALLAGAGFTAVAQGPGAGGGMSHGSMAQHQRMDPAKMQERMAAHRADLKAKLNLSPGQEGAWTDFIGAMQPPANMGQRMGRENRQQMHAEMQTLTTPQRIDRMNAMKAQRDERMAQRNEAVKTFYATLTPEQQKVFDASTMQRGGMRAGQGKHGHHS